MKDAAFTLCFAKEDFKFSAAHFTLFGADHAERFHGHNYQVSLEIRGRNLDDEGLLVSFENVKGRIRELCDHLDSRTLIPTRSPHLELSHDDGNVRVRYQERVYSFPEEDVVLLDMVNTSIELLACHLWRELAPVLDPARVDELGVNVAETAGQSCWFRAGL